MKSMKWQCWTYKYLGAMWPFGLHANLNYSCLMLYMNVYEVGIFGMNYDIDDYVWLVKFAFIHHGTFTC